MNNTDKMPRNNKTSLIQKIAKQANATFTMLNQPAIDTKVFLDNQSELGALLTAIRAADLKIAPREATTAPDSSPPVTYMHILETDAFSIGVFLLRGGAAIPLHDHPGMHGMLKVIFGKVRIRCFDKLEKPPDGETEPQFSPPLPAFQRDDLWRSTLRSSGEFSEDSGPCVLTPDRDNLHQIDAIEGPAAFLDILAPPYDPDDGRDCHYYKVLQTVAGTDKTLKEEQEETWLLKIPQPDDFWCGGEPYPGPSVSV